jgi:hypothetical protein
MSKFSEDPNRKLFVKKPDFMCWECLDYKTFYMTIRKQDQHIDRKSSRDENKYRLYMSSNDAYDDIETPELAMQAGYERANFLYKERLNSSPFKL